jgi:large subunit ribosomal protein L30
MSAKQLKITQIRSAIGRLKSHKACLRGLGIKRMNKPVFVHATAANCGMINKVAYLLKIEEI